MSYLDKLRAKAAPNPSEGFAGAMRKAVFADTDPFEGIEGNGGVCVYGNPVSLETAPTPSFLERLQKRSESEVFRRKKPLAGLDAIPQTHPRQALSKPSKGPVDFNEPQADSSRCHVCGEREEPHRPFVAVLSAKPDERHWVHHGECHIEHSRRCQGRRAPAG